ncbi:hypothetical protein [Tropicimonas isoalkanivorans]|uniref:Uncharacterized protein n=1 Tax=Tropicimonas isoalkanivorans TaxID=441112 RepID=A0A1I1PYL5_9RHOB|nr:hypothetical protein [Tropicimonas isoalkanivorans]SFD14762.1 hypothetical protein SAMN04488094_11730 [Tropicimonas isoalkanivorans]
MPRKRPTVTAPDETGWARPISAATPPPSLRTRERKNAASPSTETAHSDRSTAGNPRPDETEKVVDASQQPSKPAASGERVSIQLQVRVPDTLSHEVSALLKGNGLTDEHLRRLLAKEVAAMPFSAYAIPGSDELAAWKSGRSIGRARLSLPADLVTAYRAQHDPINVMPATNAGEAILAAHASEIWDRVIDKVRQFVG